MFTANAELDPWAALPPTGDGLLHQGPHPFSIEYCERIRVQNITGLIEIDEFRGIVAGKSERRLGQVVRPE